MTRKATADPFAIPAFLRIAPAARAKAWAGRPLTTPVFVKLQRDEDPEARAIREQLKADANTALLNRLARAKARKQVGKIDYSTMRWDPRKGKFVPDTGSKPIATTAPEPERRAARPAPKDPFRPGEINWAQLTKDNAEAIARLNGVWKDSYEKLRGTGRIVMTVGNVLKGLVKKGGEVQWS